MGRWGANALGQSTSFSYLSTGQLQVTEDALGRRTTQTFDGAGRRTAVHDANNQATLYGHLPNGLLESEENALGAVTLHSYDAVDRRTSEENPLGDSRETIYYANGWKLAELNELGFITTFSYDGAGRVTLIKDPLGDDTLHEYNADGTLATVTKPGPRVTTYEYDLAGRLRVVTDPLGRKSTLVYDADGRLVAQHDAAGNATTMAYDAAGRRIAEVNAAGRITTSTVDPAGRVVATESPVQGLWTTVYDCLDRPKARINPLGCRTTTTRDAVGNVTAETNGLGETTEFAYDVLNRRSGVTDPAGNVSTTVYDVISRVTAQINAEGYATTFAYDLANRRIALTNARGQTTSFAYDAAGRPTSETDPLGRIISFVFDGVGNVVVRTNARGQSVTMSYNAERQLLTESAPDGRITTYAYDDAGNRTSAANEHGASQWTYDSRNLPLSATSAAGRRITYAYDSLRRRATMTDPSGGLFTYGYDGADRLITVVNPRGQLVTLEYDAAGRRTHVVHGSGAATSYTLDCADRVRTVRQYRAAGVVDNVLTYTYNLAGDRTQRDELDGSVTQWSYDRARQLTYEQRTGAVAFQVTYVYDAVGNRVVEIDGGARTTYAFDAANQLTTSESAAGVTTYTHDADGNRTQRAAPAWQVDYTWDARGRLTQAVTPSQTVTLQYDALARRTSKENADGQQVFTFDGQQVLEQRDGTGQVDHEYTTTLDEYGDLLSDDDGTTTSAYQFDALGSTAALLDESGAVTDRYVYRAFGAAADHSGASDTPRTFVGQQGYQHDSELDLYFAATRHLDPATGRWISQDPQRWQAGDDNLYRYVHNNPANAVDPSGMEDLTDEQRRRAKRVIDDALAKFATPDNAVDPRELVSVNLRFDFLGLPTFHPIKLDVNEIKSVYKVTGKNVPEVSAWQTLLIQYKDGAAYFAYVPLGNDGAVPELASGKYVLGDASLYGSKAWFRAFYARRLVVVTDYYSTDEYRAAARNKLQRQADEMFVRVHERARTDQNGENVPMYDRLKAAFLAIRREEFLLDRPADGVASPPSDSTTARLQAQVDFEDNQIAAGQGWLYRKTIQRGAPPGVAPYPSIWEGLNYVGASAQIKQGGSSAIGRPKPVPPTPSGSRGPQPRPTPPTRGSAGQPPAPGVEKPAGAGGRSVAPKGTVRVFRVEGTPNTRILLGEGGAVGVVEDGTTLWLNFGSKARAEQYLSQKIAKGLPDATVKSFDVPKSLLDDIRASAVPESMAKQFPNRPIISRDPAPDQLGLRPDQIKELLDRIIQGTGKEGF